MVKKKIFVTVNAAEVREVSIPGDVEFEIIATEEDVLEIQNIFNRMDDETKSGLKYLARPFNEKSVDQKRDNESDDMVAIYELLHKLGTDETREDIESMDIL